MWVPDSLIESIHDKPSIKLVWMGKLCWELVLRHSCVERKSGLTLMSRSKSAFDVFACWLTLLKHHRNFVFVCHPPILRKFAEQVGER
jgi:hypothetical protein